MLKTLLNAVGLVACLAWLSIASAANMGGINVSSALGHPLKAEISLAEFGGDKSSLSAKLASVNDFKNAGIDYPYSLPKLSFEIVTGSKGERYLKLTSVQPVNEPFVSLLIELSWSSGKMLREYTFLLDPVGFVAEQPKAAEVKPVEPMVPAHEPEPAIVPAPAAAIVPAAPAADVAAAPVAAESKEPARAMSDMEKAELAAAEAAKAPPVAEEPAKVELAEPIKVEPLAPTAQTAAVVAPIKVVKGDTLIKIADEVKPVDISLERMLVALYRANTKSFDGKNMNRIRAGKILRMPEAEEIAKVSQVAAVKEIRAQVSDWENYRQKLSVAQTAPVEQAPKQEVAGKISAAVAEKAPAVKEPAKEVLKLSKGEALGDKAVAGAAKGKQEVQADKADDAAAKKKQAEEEQKKIAKLESLNKNVSKLVELKAAPAVVPAAEENVPASAPAPVAAASAVKPVKPLAVMPPVVEEPGIMDTIAEVASSMLEDPIMLGGVVVVLLGLGGLGFFMARRGKSGQKKSTKKSDVAGTKTEGGNKTEDIGSATGSWRTPVAPSPETGDFTQTAVTGAAAPISVAATLDDVDPISEADLFLNFGRDAQAEEILKDALVKNPSNNQVKLKLLSIYANRKDANSFSKYAQQIKESGDAAAWARAEIMGKEIDPDNPNYGAATGEARQRESAKAEVDYDLGFGSPAAPAASAAAPQDFKMDFDVTGIQADLSMDAPLDLSAPIAEVAGVSYAKPSADVDATSILSRADVAAAQASTPMDFDVSGILGDETKQGATTDAMDFDISTSIPADNKDSLDSTSMDFDLTGDIPAAAPVPEAKPASSAMNFDDLVFEIPTEIVKPAAEAPKPAASDAMEFTLDFPGSAADFAPGKPQAAEKLDIDFGDININIGDEEAAPSGGAEIKGEQWNEVATKLDLAKAYQEMGDADGAREILEEVMRDGDEGQRAAATKLLQQIDS